MLIGVVPMQQIVTFLPRAAPQQGDLLNLYTAKSTGGKHQKPISFRELTAEFDRFENLVLYYFILGNF